VVIISHMTGIEGQVELVGYKAVVAMFLRWTLERRGEDGSGQPVWTLRASLSYQKDSMLNNPALKKRITIKYPGKEYICEPLAGVVPYIDKKTDKYVIEGVTLCLPEEKP